MQDLGGESSAPETDDLHAQERRAFLKKYSKFAIVVPPAVTLLLASSSKKALASGAPGNSGGNPFGGPPGKNP